MLKSYLQVVVIFSVISLSLFSFLQIPRQISLIVRTLHLFEECNLHICQSSEFQSVKDLISRGMICVFDEICKDKVCYTLTRYHCSSCI